MLAASDVKQQHSLVAVVEKCESSCSWKWSSSSATCWLLICCLARARASRSAGPHQDWGSRTTAAADRNQWVEQEVVRVGGLGGQEVKNKKWVNMLVSVWM